MSSAGRFALFPAAFLIMACAACGQTQAPTGGGFDSGPADGSIPDGGADAGSVAASSRALFVLSADRRELPIPFDFFTNADGTTPTGLRIALGEKYNEPLEAGMLFAAFDRYKAALEENDGWSSLAPAYITVSKPLDTKVFERTDMFTGADSPIWLFRVDGASSIAREKIAAEYREIKTAYGSRLRYISIRPGLPLDPKTRYAIALFDSLVTNAGSPLGADNDFIAVRDGTGSGADYERARGILGPGFDLLSGGGADLKKVALLTVFTTGSLVEDYEAISGAIDSGEANPGFKPGALASISSPPEASAEVKGAVGLAQFTGSDGVFVRNGDGKPAVQGYEDIQFILLYPKTGKQPYNVCIYQHGLSGSKEAIYSQARGLLAEGIAVIGIDTVAHGSRSANPDQAAIAFLSIGEPSRARDNFRQAAAEHMQLARMIKNMKSVDLYPAGGDGKPDFDTSKVCYLGQSLGGIIGTTSIAMSKDIGAGVINVGGGVLMELVTYFIGNYAPTLMDTPELPLFAGIAEQVLDRSDPANFGRYIIKSPAGHVGFAKQVLLQEAINDGTVPNISTEHLARSLGAPQIAPWHTDVWGVERREAPWQGSAFLQYSPGEHGLIDVYSGPMAGEGARMRRQLGGFIRSWLDTGAGVVEP